MLTAKANRPTPMAMGILVTLMATAILPTATGTAILPTATPATGTAIRAMLWRRLLPASLSSAYYGGHRPVYRSSSTEAIGPPEGLRSTRSGAEPPVTSMPAVRRTPSTRRCRSSAPGDVPFDG